MLEIEADITALPASVLREGDTEAGQETRLSAGQPIRVGSLGYYATAGRKAINFGSRRSLIARTCSAQSCNALRFSVK